MSTDRAVAAQCGPAPGISTAGTAPAWLAPAQLPRQQHSTPWPSPHARLQGTRGIPTPSHTAHLTARQPAAAKPSVAAEVGARKGSEGKGELTNPWTEATHPTHASQQHVTGTWEKSSMEGYVYLQACMQRVGAKSQKSEEKRTRKIHREKKGGKRPEK